MLKYNSSCFDPYWIIILFFIYLDPFRVKNKLDESACRAILVAGPSFENWGLKPFEDILRHQMIVLRVKNFPT
jgi:hypothetical protein